MLVEEQRMNPTLVAARDYRRRGWAVIDLPHASKSPNRSAWQHERLSEADLLARFGTPPVNIGVLVGEPSGGLVDIDLDCPEAQALAERFLPPTGAVFGRATAPASHRLYLVDPLLRTKQYQDTDGAMLMELRTNGQTVFPPSMHPTGETIRWDRDGEPASIAPDVLSAAVARLAAASLLARHWPSQGSRHHAALALSGALLRAGWSVGDVEAFVGAVAIAAGDEEAALRVRQVQSTAERLDRSAAATGFIRLAALLGQQVIQRMVEFLGTVSFCPILVNSNEENRLGADGTGLVLPKSSPLGENMHQENSSAMRLRFHTAAEGADTETCGVTWLWQDYLAFGAVTELDARIKVGKTTLTLALCRAVLDGLPFLGLPTAKSRVVYLTEQPRSSFNAALAKAGLLGRDDFVYLRWHDTIGVPWPAVVAAAVEQCAQHGAGLLLVDTLAQFAGIADENDATEALAAMQPLQLAAERHGLAVLLLRHERKSGGAVGDSARGSSAFGGIVDVVLSLRRLEGDGRRTLREIHAISRFDTTPECVVIELTPTGFTAHGDRADVAFREAVAVVLQICPTNEGDALTLRALTEAAPGVKRTTLQRALDDLLRKEQVVRIGAGKKGDPYRYYRPKGA